MIIPVKSYEINTDKFYENKENYLKIYVRDTSNEVKQKRAKLYIIDKDGSRRENINFLDYVENTKVSLQK